MARFLEMGTRPRRGPMIPVTTELLADHSPNLLKLVRWQMIVGFAMQRARAAGRIEERGGGWYRLDGETIRGRRAVRARIEAEVEKAGRR